MLHQQLLSYSLRTEMLQSTPSRSICLHLSMLTSVNECSLQSEQVNLSISVYVAQTVAEIQLLFCRYCVIVEHFKTFHCLTLTRSTFEDMEPSSAASMHAGDGVCLREL